MLTGEQQYREAKRIIPGGTQLLSKRPELYAPDLWPAYASKAKGTSIWDLDGNRYTDMSTMGIGSCLLGYAASEVNEAVKKAVDNGSMCSLNFSEEVELAQLLIELHPWAEMVRFARTGGEAVAVAVRLARSATGRSQVAFCGYHGWHDWYLAGNLAGDDALDGHLLPGLSPSGVPKELYGTSIPFHYNDKEEFERAISDREVAAVIMEPMRFKEPDNDFLSYVKRRSEQIGAVLIFDEITSGWRQCVGGLHMKLGIEPDISVFAKAMSNGYPCAAVLGKESLMQEAQKTFISSTYWTERIGFSAAISTIEAMIKQHVPQQLQEIGQRVQHIWKQTAEKTGLDIVIEGHASLSHFSLNYDENQILSTIITQQLLKRGFLGTTAFYPSSAHQKEDLDRYEQAFEAALMVVSDAVESGKPQSFLEGPVAQKGFARL
jgi:glutamate-1-semialdehyde aminotransferase